MSDRPKSFQPPLVVLRTSPIPLEPDDLIRWKSLCKDNPGVERRAAERFLTRLTEAFLDDRSDDELIEYLEAWEAQTAPAVALMVSAYQDDFFIQVVGESRRGAVACVLAALEIEGFVLADMRLWSPNKKPDEVYEDDEPAPKPEGHPLFVLEMDVLGPLPDGIATVQAAEKRLLARLRPAFALLQQGHVGRA